MSIAYYRTRIRRLLVLFLLAALLGVNMVAPLAEEALEEGIPAFEMHRDHAVLAPLEPRSRRRVHRRWPATLYEVTDEELVVQLLVRYCESFLDRAVDRLIDF